jgi:hypothetical protein
MRQIGSFMFIIGVLAIVLNFVDRVPTVLAWIYQWGDTTAWGIKIALVVVGAALWILSSRGAKTE